MSFVLSLEIFLRPEDHAGVTCSTDPNTKEVVVTSLSRDDSFFNAGVLPDDVILSVDGKRSVSHKQVIDQIQFATTSAKERRQVIPITVRIRRTVPSVESPPSSLSASLSSPLLSDVSL